jgi:hypothetical protein
MTHLLRYCSGLAAVACLLFTVPARAAWTSLALPDLGTDFGSYHMGHTADGRLIYGSDNDLDRQVGFQLSGAVALTDYQNAGVWFPSSVSLFNDTLGVVGQGAYGASQIYVFNPSDLATPFTAIPNVTLQDYSVLFRDASSLYVGGLNGTGGKHAVSYVTLAGTSQLLIDDISTYSGDMALDSAGNLYISNNDDLSLYEFPAAQLSIAIATHRTLTLADGAFLTKLHRNASLAVDAQGRIWSAGYQGSGLEMFDPANGIFTPFTPALDNSTYVVSTFSIGPTSYVGFINASGYFQGSTLTYGFDLVENLVPEPGSGALLLLGLAVFVRRRR